MRRTVAALLLLPPVIGARPARAQGDLTAFYAVARDRAATPPAEGALKVLCDVKLEGDEYPQADRGRYVTFIGTTPPQVLLAALTPKRIKRVEDVLSLHVLYNPLPTALPRRDGTLDWAYLFDRNGDGRVDYFAYLQNAHAVLPDTVPPDFPRPVRDSAGKVRMSLALLDSMISRGRMVFRHYADDDFDGRVDGFVTEEFDAERWMFVRDWLIFRAARAGGAPAEGWAFRQTPADTVRILAPGPSGFDVPSPVPGGPPTPVDSVLARATERLGEINRAFAQCPAGAAVLERGN